MSPMTGSQGVVLATAMVISSTVLFIAFSKHKNLPPILISHPPKKPLRSCLISEGKKRERKRLRVRFAENVKEPSGNGEEYRREHYRRQLEEFDRSNCRTQISAAGNRPMPANREALYGGILRDRVHRVECSH